MITCVYLYRIGRGEGRGLLLSASVLGFFGYDIFVGLVGITLIVVGRLRAPPRVGRVCIQGRLIFFLLRMPRHEGPRLYVSREDCFGAVDR